MSDVRDEARAAKPAEAGATGDFIWYELMTPDPEGAKAFYDSVIGWTIGEAAPKFNGYRMIGRSDGGFAGGVLPLTAEMQRHGARPVWLGYVSVPDVDQATAEIVKAGGTALMPAFDIPGVGRIALVADPQGAAFYVMKPTPPEPKAQSDVFSPTAQQRAGWNELNTSDPAAARSFYASQFGWDTGDFMDMGDLGEYRFIDHRGTRLGALCGVMPGAKPAWRFYFRVPSIAAAKEAVEARGGSVGMGPHQVPTGDWIIIGTDPQGAEFALVGGQ
ncbi:MAG TPA: VOC family protein [Sphingomicrobium sp.]|nr:VOC family protein [Sphingomicrobium sp.]